MASIPDDARDALEMALKNELKAREILQEAKESVSNLLAKATFDFLAAEELKHIDIIRKFAESLYDVGKFDVDELVSTTTPDARRHIMSIFERFKTAFEAAGASDEQRLETYRVAMDMERRGHDFYSQAAREAKDETARKLYQFLAGEETKHFELIQDTHDFLQQPDALLAIEERWMQV